MSLFKIIFLTIVTYRIALAYDIKSSQSGETSIQVGGIFLENPVLNLSNINLNGSVESIIGNDLQLLESLYLEFNHITDLGETIFTEMDELQLLSLRGNLLNELHENLFRENLKLTDVDLSQNQLKIIPADIFECNVELRHVDLFDNICISRQYTCSEDKRLSTRKLMKHLRVKCSVVIVGPPANETSTIKIPTTISTFLVAGRNLETDAEINFASSSNSSSDAVRSNTSDEKSSSDNEILPHLYGLILPISIILAIILIVLCCVVYKNFFFYIVSLPQYKQ